jgi:hypothetical protein
MALDSQGLLGLIRDYEECQAVERLGGAGKLALLHSQRERLNLQSDTGLCAGRCKLYAKLTLLDAMRDRQVVQIITHIRKSSVERGTGGNCRLTFALEMFNERLASCRFT